MARKAAIVGGGVIGGGWTARFLLNGWDVGVFDPDPQAERKISEVLANARAALPALSDVPMPPEGKLTFHGTIGEAVEGAEYVQESVSERIELKHRVYAQLQQANPGVLIGSSTSGFKATDLQQGSPAPENIIVAHPFNPVYLLPLSEISGSEKNTEATVQKTVQIMKDIGMFPLVIRHEIDAFIGNRFLEAVWREALWMLKDGIATTEEIDEAIRMGFGLRWGQMGLFETYRIAGGEAGMKHFMAQFGPALKWPWTKLMDVPEFNDELVELVSSQSDAQSGMYSIRELERIRDQNLVGFLRSLKDRNWGAGKVLREHDEARAAAFHAEMQKGIDTGPKAAPLVMAQMQVLPGWIDYNGHMTESRYYFANSETVDNFLRLIGAGMDYVAAGQSFYSAETHIRHLGEAKLGDRIRGELQIISADEKRFRSFVRIMKDDECVATIEQVCLHVDMKAGKSSRAAPEVWAKLQAIAEAHASLPLPEGAGRAVGQKR
ncbi:carnitine 3-dehydrogenase [Xinfangfangia sp. CPCC 101601]|uniref:L-carnitine dehydrogenase n=1 Tax=Pseudogemmobacter lacusdianii TaxID=3069608 RepID=A0ABU0W004_9RHOB|nr:carnitine 3-dehydrogenase [Xinfangfangia sp. CPCC 101601]MDQ2067342.1 carnitine 3-dehydrogenase [Xinfangfangia sp. CPCC 101601]